MSQKETEKIDWRFFFKSPSYLNEFKKRFNAPERASPGVKSQYATFSAYRNLTNDMLLFLEGTRVSDEFSRIYQQDPDIQHVLSPQNTVLEADVIQRILQRYNIEPATRAQQPQPQAQPQFSQQQIVAQPQQQPNQQQIVTQPQPQRIIQQLDQTKRRNVTYQFYQGQQYETFKEDSKTKRRKKDPELTVAVRGKFQIPPPFAVSLPFKEERPKKDKVPYII